MERRDPVKIRKDNVLSKRVAGFQQWLEMLFIKEDTRESFNQHLFLRREKEVFQFSIFRVKKERSVFLLGQ